MLASETKFEYSRVASSESERVLALTREYSLRASDRQTDGRTDGRTDTVNVKKVRNTNPCTFKLWKQVKSFGSFPSNDVDMISP